MKQYRPELSLAIALIAMLLCCALLPQQPARWWSVAFAPLCDGILTGSDAEGIVLRSKLLELLLRLARS